MLPKFQKESVCRICLQTDESDEMPSIFDCDENNLCLLQKIEMCAGIKLLQGENLPSKICGNCYVFLNFAYKFGTICRNSNNYLREFVSKQRTTTTTIRKKVVKANNSIATVAVAEPSDEEFISEPSADDNIIRQDETPSNANTVDDIIEDLGEGDYTEIWFEDDNHNDDDGGARIEEVYVSNDEDEDGNGDDDQKDQIITSKTLDISSDGTAVIRVLKSKAKRDKTEQKHICDVCGNCYPKKYTLEAHMRRHRDEKPYECEICGQAFHFNFQLTRHIRKHTGVRPYSCQYCLRTFKDRSTLVKHERIHRNERPFKCDTCGKTFTYSNVLKSHMLTHTGEKPYTCGICNKRFTRSHHLRAHLETLYHSRDPRTQMLLKQIKPDEPTTVPNLVDVVEVPQE